VLEESFSLLFLGSLSNRTNCIADNLGILYSSFLYLRSLFVGN
jgi:hypothetical protein